MYTFKLTDRNGKTFLQKANNSVTAMTRAKSLNFYAVKAEKI